MARQKTVSQSQHLINQLKASGMSYSQIGKAVGRDSSLISQGAKGKKPLVNIEGALKALVEKRKPEPPARRLARSGAEAKVRQPKPKKEIEAITDKKGRVMNADVSGMSKADARALLRKIKKDGGVISFTAKAKGYKKYRQLDPGEVDVNIFEDGLDADDFALDDDFETTLMTALIDDYDVASVDALTDIQLNVFY